MTDLALLLMLILVNGVFAMAEIAVVSSRRARLQQLADEGRRGARLALRLAEDPTRFLATVQVGITSIGILSGAVGESAIAARLEVWLATVPAVAAYAEPISMVIMVVSLTYVALILGELVPKRLGLASPERVAALVAGPMALLAKIGRPLVFVLSASTEFVLTLVGRSRTPEAKTSDEEIKLLMRQGALEGVFAPGEQALVANVLHLDDRHVATILTPRSDVVFLDVGQPWVETARTLQQSPHAVLPVCRGGLDDVIGMVRSSTVLGHLLRGATIDLAALAAPALFVPRTVTLLALLQQFRQVRLPIALVVDEFGGVNGLVSLTDVTAAIVGELPETHDGDPSIVSRENGTYLVDGAVDLARLAQHLNWQLAADDGEQQHYHTLGGLAMYVLGRVPRVGDIFERAECRFEVVDMDGHRVDRVLVSRKATGATAEAAPDPAATRTSADPETPHR